MTGFYEKTGSEELVAAHSLSTGHTDSGVSGVEEGHQLKWNDTSKKWVNFLPDPVDVITLAGISDVSTTPATDTQVLTWNEVSGLWVPSLAIAAGTTLNLNDLLDVTASTPSDDYVLTWDSSTSLWVAQVNNSLAAGIIDGGMMSWFEGSSSWLENAYFKNRDNAGEYFYGNTDGDVGANVRFNTVTGEMIEEGGLIENYLAGGPNVVSKSLRQKWVAMTATATTGDFTAESESASVNLIAAVRADITAPDISLDAGNVFIGNSAVQGAANGAGVWAGAFASSGCLWANDGNDLVTPNVSAPLSLAGTNLLLSANGLTGTTTITTKSKFNVRPTDKSGHGMQMNSVGDMTIGPEQVNSTVRLRIISDASNVNAFQINTQYGNAFSIGTSGTDNVIRAPAVVYGNAGGTPILVTMNTSSGEMALFTSARRFKKNILSLAPGTAELMQMRAVSYNTISDETNTPRMGFIAEEVAEIPGLEGLVAYHNDEVLTVQYLELTALLVKTIQELNVRIEALET